MKACAKCGDTKKLEEFHRMAVRKDGRKAECKTCDNARQRARSKTEHAKALRKRWERETETGRAYKKRKLLAYDQKKRRAGAYARQAKWKGRLIEDPCEKCGATADIHMHHDDYSKPLEVRWLCRGCHEIEHKGPLDRESPRVVVECYAIEEPSDEG